MDPGPTALEILERAGESPARVNTISELIELRIRSDVGITLIDRELRETPLPYSVLATGARYVAARLVEAGVHRGDRVALIASTSAPMLTTLFGVWRTGATPVILPLPNRMSDADAVCRDFTERVQFAGCVGVAVADNLARLIGPEALPASVMKCSELVQATEAAPPPVDTDGGAVAYLQFTSGTTGASRAVTLTHRQMLTNAAATLAHLRPQLDNPPFVHVSWLPLCHDMGLMTVLGAVFIDSELVLQPPEEFLREPHSWVDALSRYRATTTWAPNFAYALAARGLTTRPRALDLSSLQVAGNGAEPIRLDTLAKFTAAGAKYGLRPEAVMPMYGLAEATVAVCLGNIGKPIAYDVVSRTGLEYDRVARTVGESSPDARKLVVCGDPISGVELAIVDERTGEHVGERRVGEICVRGPSVMLGYWRNPAETEQVLRGGWLHTGDLGYLVADGLVVCGRLKDMIIVAGRNIYPEDYEQVCGAVEGVRVAAAFALPDVEQMVIVVEPDLAMAEYVELGQRVVRQLRERVGYVPNRIFVVKRGSIPLTSSGKIRRFRCRELHLTGGLPVLADVSGES